MIMLNHNLRIFLQVAENESITDTANKLFISQPAVSKAIKNLEKELQLKLFHRDKRNGLRLTDAGAKILLLARQMADMENRIYQTAFRENNFLGSKLRLASMPILTSVILAPAIHEFRQKYPFVTLELVEGSSMEIRRAVENYKVDFALTSAPFDGLDYELLFTDHMTAVSKEPISLQPICLSDNQYDYILCKAGYETVMELLQSQKIHLHHAFLVEQAETVISLVAQGNGVGIVSELVLDHTLNNLHRMAISPAIDIEIGLIANSLKDLTPVAQEMKQILLKQFTVLMGHKNKTP